MLRVVHCIYDDPHNPWVGGGGALRVFEIYRRLTEEVDITVATGNFPGAWEGEREGVRYRRLGAVRPYAWSRVSYGVAATRLLARGDFDVGIFDYSVYTPVRVPRDRPVGLVVHMLHAPTARGRWGAVGGALVERVEAAGIGSVRWVSTTSGWMVEQLRPLVAPGAEIMAVGSGVPAEFGLVQRKEEDFFLYYGRLDVYQKGLDTLLSAFQELRRSERTRLVIAGRGKDALRLRQMVDGAGIAASVEVRAGVDRSEVLDLMGRALALVMPSRLEGLPMVPAEAMAAGLPVIAAEVGAMREVVDPDRTGILVPPDDPGALLAAMRRIVGEPALRARMSDAARRSAERFSWDRVARAHLHFLHTIAGSPAPAPQGE